MSAPRKRIHALHKLHRPAGTSCKECHYIYPCATILIAKGKLKWSETLQAFIEQEEPTE